MMGDFSGHQNVRDFSVFLSVGREHESIVEPETAAIRQTL
jgi:hypothetical protein